MRTGAINVISATLWRGLPELRAIVSAPNLNGQLMVNDDHYTVLAATKLSGWKKASFARSSRVPRISHRSWRSRAMA
eukprot:167119-Amphidinium_carterae.1